MFSADPKKTMFFAVFLELARIDFGQMIKRPRFDVFTIFLEKWVLHFSTFWENLQNHVFLHFPAFPESRKNDGFQAGNVANSIHGPDCSD